MLRSPLGKPLCIPRYSCVSVLVREHAGLTCSTASRESFGWSQVESSNCFTHMRQGSGRAW